MVRDHSALPAAVLATRRFAPASMSSSSSILPSPSVQQVSRPVWREDLGTRPRGLALAREKGSCLIWDEEQYVYLFSRTGATQARTKTPDRIVAACAADDGSAFVA